MFYTELLKWIHPGKRKQYVEPNLINLHLKVSKYVFLKSFSTESNHSQMSGSSAKALVFRCIGFQPSTNSWYTYWFFYPNNKNGHQILKTFFFQYVGLWAQIRFHNTAVCLRYSAWNLLPSQPVLTGMGWCIRVECLLPLCSQLGPQHHLLHTTWFILCRSSFAVF